MNYDFTDGARKALALAREAAISLRHEYIGTEHMLLGVVRVDESGPLRDRLGFEARHVEARVKAIVLPGKGPPHNPRMGELPYTSRSKKALEYAMASGRELGHKHIGTEHLLLGLLREEKGKGALILNELGVTFQSALVAVENPDATMTPRFHVRIDDAADISIYEQIVAQVQEAVATGVLLPGDRLPTVRQLADELDIAPGTVARAYSELERRAVVVTEGARGTRVAQPERRDAPDEGRPDTLTGLLRPVAVAAFHLGANAQELRAALERAMAGIFGNGTPQSGGGR